MNRLIIIGNGFDLAHGLKTSYKDFIEWYWEQTKQNMQLEHSREYKDEVSTITLKSIDASEDWFTHMFLNFPLKEVPGNLFLKVLKHDTDINVSLSLFFDIINKNIDRKRWVDIEREYYTFLKNINAVWGEQYKAPKVLNDELDFLKKKLIEYLIQVQSRKYSFNQIIRKQILAPISIKDIAIGRLSEFYEWLDSLYLIPDYNWKEFAMAYGANWNAEITEIGKFRKGYDSGSDEDIEARRQGVPDALRVPNRIMLLNFNYTDVADKYMPQDTHFPVVHIHGKLDDKDSVIFGYGDELDEEYKNLERKNDNEFLRNVKSVHYLESTSYRQMLDFIESDLYQVYIMGHSCGNSDRTLLNTLFEHPNCISVKPYYYKKDDTHDNYLEMVQNITRNFNDKKLMRDRVVNKEFCEPLG